jgi:hypothetical protein
MPDQRLLDLLDPSSRAEFSQRLNLDHPLTRRLADALTNKAAAGAVFGLPTVALSRFADATSKLPDALTFPQRLMQTAAGTPFGLRRSDFTDIPGPEPSDEMVGMATDMAMNMVGSPVLSTSAATLGSGAVRGTMRGMAGAETVKEAAVEIGGKIFRGPNHAVAIRNAELHFGKPFEQLIKSNRLYGDEAVRYAADQGLNLRATNEKALEALGARSLIRRDPNSVWVDVEPNVEGFVTSAGRFISRDEAIKMMRPPKGGTSLGSGGDKRTAAMIQGLRATQGAGGDIPVHALGSVGSQLKYSPTISSFGPWETGGLDRLIEALRQDRLKKGQQ